jgi:hypothetical protein
MLAEDDEELKSELKSGIVGIDLIAVPRTKGASARRGVGSRVALVKV